VNLGLVPLAIATIGASYAALVLRGWRRRDNLFFGLVALTDAVMTAWRGLNVLTGSAIIAASVVQPCAIGTIVLALLTIEFESAFPRRPAMRWRWRAAMLAWGAAGMVLMLVTLGMLAGRTRRAQLGYTAVAFGVWDIFYYVFLRLIGDWPRSLFDWDILFLIPLPWWGPVLAPVCIASLMIVWGTHVTQWQDRLPATRFTWQSPIRRVARARRSISSGACLRCGPRLITHGLESIRFSQRAAIRHGQPQSQERALRRG